ncbi:dehydrogenase [Sinorhizobium meliloti CCBAU 01290]|nr:dehydrogenase [Sinorhizobium meliloti CCBAU 01290]
MSFIFSTHRLHPDAEAMLKAAGELRVASAPDPETLLREGEGAEIVIVRAPIPPAFFGNVPALRAVVRHGAGLDMIPYDAATTAGVLIANVPAVNAPTLRSTFSWDACVAAPVPSMDRDLRNMGWSAGRAHSDRALDLAGRIMGVIGMGNVGKAVFRIAKYGFQLEIVANSRSPESLPDGVRFLSVDDLLSTADIVVLSCPLTPKTTGLLSRERIARMKPGAILVNVSRGPVVDDAALIEALERGRIGGAALDVFSTQPLPPEHPYFRQDNVIVTPHLAGITEESMMRMGTGAATEAIRVMEGGLPVNLRNPEVVEHYRRRFPA